MEPYVQTDPLTKGMRMNAQPECQMPGWKSETGKGMLRTLFALALVVGTVYVGMKFIPVRAQAYQFNDAVRDEVVFAGGRRSSDDAIRKNLVEQAQMLGLPVSTGSIKITRPGSKYIKVEVDYTITVELIGGYTYDWSFSPKAEGPLIF